MNLMQLPGVGRKTANVITSVIDRQPNMAVDTHVFRVSKRIGLVPQTASTPLAVEKELIKNIPENLIHKAHHWLILHGRYICVARNPKCEQCGLQNACRYFQREKTLSIIRNTLFLIINFICKYILKAETRLNILEISIILVTVSRSFITYENCTNL